MFCFVLAGLAPTSCAVFAASLACKLSSCLLHLSTCPSPLPETESLNPPETATAVVGDETPLSLVKLLLSPPHSRCASTSQDLTNSVSFAVAHIASSQCIASTEAARALQQHDHEDQESSEDPN